MCVAQSRKIRSESFCLCTGTRIAHFCRFFGDLSNMKLEFGQFGPRPIQFANDGAQAIFPYRSNHHNGRRSVGHGVNVRQ